MTTLSRWPTCLPYPWLVGGPVHIVSVDSAVSTPPEHLVKHQTNGYSKEQPLPTLYNLRPIQVANLTLKLCSTRTDTTQTTCVYVKSTLNKRGESSKFPFHLSIQGHPGLIIHLSPCVFIALNISLYEHNTFTNTGEWIPTIHSVLMSPLQHILNWPKFPGTTFTVIF